jgi:hypothetical protein
MTEPNQQRICAVRLPGTSRARFADAGDLDVALGDWVTVPSPAGEEPAEIVVAPDQWLSPVTMNEAADISRLLDDSELASVAGNISRAISLIDTVADALRAVSPDLFLSGLRFNLTGDHLIAAYIGNEPVDPARIQRVLSDAAGAPVTLEQERAARPDSDLHGGGTGRPSMETPGTLEELLQQRFDVLRDPGTFAPQGLPRLGSRVNTPGGTGMLVAVDIRHWQATVSLDDGEEVTVSVDQLSQPG